MTITQHDLEDFTNETGTGGGGGGGTITGAQNVGAGTGLIYRGVTGTVLDIKSLVQGTGISLTNGANDITIASTITQGLLAVANTGNVGAGTAGVWSQTLSTTAYLKRLNQGSNVTITEDANNIYISAAGGGGGGTISGAITPNQVAYCNIANEITGEAGFEYDDTINQMVVEDVKMKYPIYDVRWFGAVGDGVTDDTAAIQLAIDTCSAEGGGTVFFPGRNPVGSGLYYQVTGQGGGGNGTALLYKKGVDLVGAGIRASVINWAAAGTNGEILDTTNVDMSLTQIRNLQFSCTGAGSTVNGIRGGSTLINYNSGLITFENLLFIFLDTGIIGDGVPGVIGFFDCNFKNVTFSACGNGLNTYGSGNELYACRFFQNTNAGLVVGYQSSESMGGHNLFGCTFINNKYDIYVVGTEVRQNNFDSCWFETSTDGILFVPAPLKAQVFNIRGCTLQTNVNSPAIMLDVSNLIGSVNVYNCSILQLDPADDYRIIGNPANQRLMIRDNMTYASGGPGLATGTECTVIANKNGTPQSISAATPTLITWSTEVEDMENCFTANTFTAKYTGTYLFRANLTFDKFALAAANPYAYIQISSTAVIATVRLAPANTTLGNYQTIVLSALWKCAVGETFKVYVTHADSGAVSLLGDTDLTNLHICRIY